VKKVAPQPHLEEPIEEVMVSGEEETLSALRRALQQETATAEAGEAETKAES
jgi:hypothetical protein